MADRYIDTDETQVYGPYASKQIRRQVVGLVSAFDPGLTYLADAIDGATATVKKAVEAARDAEAEVRKIKLTKTPALEHAVDVLRRFSKHLDTHKAGSVDRKAFFTTNGTTRAIGRSASRVLLTLTQVSRELKKKGSPVNDGDRWLKEITTAARDLRSPVEQSVDVRTDRHAMTPDVEAARAAWLTTYVAARAGVECVLRLTGKQSAMPRVFYDLAVPAGAKVTAAPDEPPPRPAPPSTPATG